MIREQPTLKEKKALLILAGAAAVFLLAFLIGTRARNSYGLAAIDYDGRRVTVLDLADYTDSVVISMNRWGVDVPVDFELKDHQIRFYQVDCPDKLCEGFGFIGRPMQTAVCLPNRVSVSILQR